LPFEMLNNNGGGYMLDTHTYNIFLIKRNILLWLFFSVNIDM
jgi:hypothetical protein